MTEMLSPTPGLFWHRPDPGSEVFCKPGDTVEIGQQIGVVEVMKMFAPIEAEVAGVFTGYAVDSGAQVDAGQVIATFEAS